MTIAQLERLAIEASGTVTCCKPVTSNITQSIMVEAPIVVSEKSFDAAVVKEAKRLGWMTYHTYRSIKSEAGFPDRVFVRRRRLIFAELKTETGKMSAAQETWKESLSEIGGVVEYYLWRPSDWTAILQVLK